jgi:hypothetical protein
MMGVLTLPADPTGKAPRVDIDDTIRRTYGYAKQGAGYGYSKTRSPTCRPAISRPTPPGALWPRSPTIRYAP